MIRIIIVERSSSAVSLGDPWKAIIILTEYGIEIHILVDIINVFSGDYILVSLLK